MIRICRKCGKQKRRLTITFVPVTAAKLRTVAASRTALNRPEGIPAARSIADTIRGRRPIKTTVPAPVKQKPELAPSGVQAPPAPKLGDVGAIARKRRDEFFAPVDPPTACSSSRMKRASRFLASPRQGLGGAA